MTASQIAKLLHGVKSGTNWMCRCPVNRLHPHGDRHRSLSVREIGGWVRLKCFSGCSREEILAAMGLRIADLALTAPCKVTPAMRDRWTDEDRLKTLERRHGLFIMLQAVEPDKWRSWAAAERNTAIEIAELRRKLFPVQEYYRRRNERTQAIIAAYGLTELWNCLPERKP